jgi:hypothetical protein
MNYELSFLKALVFTIVIETLTLWMLVKTFERKGNISLFTVLISGFFASFATLPYLWFILPLFFHGRVTYPLVSEFLAVALESLILLGFLKVKYLKCLLLSIICNMTSFIAGLILSHLFPGWMY